MSLSDALGGSWDSFSDLENAVSAGYGREDGGRAADYSGGTGGSEASSVKDIVDRGPGKSLAPAQQASEQQASEKGDPASLIIQRAQRGQISADEAYRLLTSFYNNQTTAWDYLTSFGIQPETATRPIGVGPTAPGGGGVATGLVPVTSTGGGTAQQAPEAGGLTGQAAILEDLAAGRITEAQALQYLRELGVPNAQAQASINARQGRPAVDPLVFDELQERLGASDIARGFALRSNVAPGFRDIVEQSVGRRWQPFGFQAAMGQIPGLKFEDFEADPLGSFRQHLESSGLGARTKTGGLLRNAFDFIQNPTQGQDFNPQQEAVRHNIFNEGEVGSARFAPLLNMIGQQFGRNLPGFNVGGATQRSLQNVLSRDPYRFGPPEDFGAFLRQQGII